MTTIQQIGLGVNCRDYLASRLTSAGIATDSRLIISPPPVWVIIACFCLRAPVFFLDSPSKKVWFESMIFKIFFFWIFEKPKNSKLVTMLKIKVQRLWWSLMFSEESFFRIFFFWFRPVLEKISQSLVMSFVPLTLFIFQKKRSRGVWELETVMLLLHILI